MPNQYACDTANSRSKRGGRKVICCSGFFSKDNVGKDADRPVDNPLLTVDKILEDTKHVKCAAIVVNIHGDYSSEKKVMGYYLDGRVTAVIGDHWHVPTADAMVLPKGTAHITDVGMCGVLQPNGCKAFAHWQAG